MQSSRNLPCPRRLVRALGHRRVGEGAGARRRGFTLAESLVSIIIVSGAMVAALNAAGGAVVARQATSRTRVAQVLAESLMNEILDMGYWDLNAGPFSWGFLGLDSGEAGASRNLFDDVDDYHNMVESPPKERDGAAIANASGWSRSTAVRWVSPGSPNTTSWFDNGVKRITVVVKFGNKELVTLIALKAAPHPDSLSIAAQ